MTNPFPRKQNLMSRWTSQGDQLIHEVAQRYGVSNEAVSLMLDSVLRGGGTMAQFNINELGGGGQWMRGGMTMVGDMFNYNLKSKVDGICGELSNAICNQNIQVVPTPPPGQSPTGNHWYPSDLGSPSTSGGQNQYKYAFFPSTHRLAVTDGVAVTVYDTLDHQIGGVSQQQGSGGPTVSFTSQYGTIDLRSLPLLSGPGRGAALQPQGQRAATQSPPVKQEFAPPMPAPPQQASSPMAPPQSASGSGLGSTDDVFAMIERLAKLRDSGAITDDDYNQKKIDLLSRI